MRNVFLILSLLFAATLKAQTPGNEVVLSSRPVAFNSGFDNKFRTSGNVFIGYNRAVYQFKNNSSISIGAYAGGVAHEEGIRQTWQGIVNFNNSVASSVTAGLKARYNFFVAKDDAFAAHFSFLGEMVWTDGTETYENTSDEAFYIYGREIPDNYLAPNQTRHIGYSRRSFNLLCEMGYSQRIYKGLGYGISALWNMHTNDFIGSVGVNYKF